MSNRVNGGLRARPIERFGWVPDLPDARDFMFSAPEAILTKMPTKVDLTRRRCRRSTTRAQLGSCTANAIGAAFEFDQVKEGYKDFMPSRLFIYYNERAMEGTIDTDSGRDDPRRDEERRQGRSLRRGHLAVRHPEVHGEAAHEGLHRGEEAPGAALQAA